MIEVEDAGLGGVKIIKPKVFGDARGFFMETFNARDAAAAGLPVTWVQDNHSQSTRGVLRGLHFQYPLWQGKLVRVARGEIFDVAVDIRPESASYGKWFGTNLSEANKLQMYVPEGFAHGFAVLSDTADVIYKCTTLYEPAQDRCLLWNDPDIGVDWPLDDPLVSDKDRKGVHFRDLEF